MKTPHKLVMVPKAATVRRSWSVYDWTSAAATIEKVREEFGQFGSRWNFDCYKVHENYIVDFHFRDHNDALICSLKYLE